ncbi:MAG: hypothetical protein ACRDD1_12215, partial [Planctomycetia bacterium]
MIKLSPKLLLLAAACGAGMGPAFEGPTLARRADAQGAPGYASAGDYAAVDPADYQQPAGDYAGDPYADAGNRQVVDGSILRTAGLHNYYKQQAQGLAGNVLPSQQPQLPPFVDHSQLTSDASGTDRMNLPTPVNGTGFAGAGNVGHNPRPDAATLGLRLDTSYILVRSADFGVMLAEHQQLGYAGATILPYQSPCLIVGARGVASIVGNTEYLDPTGGASFDLYAGTRYKTAYLKGGALWDYQVDNDFSKVGVTF